MFHLKEVNFVMNVLFLKYTYIYDAVEKNWSFCEYVAFFFVC